MLHRKVVILTLVLLLPPIVAASAVLIDQEAEKVLIATIEQERIEHLRSYNAFFPYERITDLRELIPESVGRRPDNWVLLFYSPMLGPHVPLANVPCADLERINLPQPHALHPGVPDPYAGIYAQSRHYVLQYHPAPLDIKKSALFHLRRLTAEKTLESEVDTRVQKRIESQDSLSLMRASLMLCSNDRSTPAAASLEDAAYNYALTMAHCICGQGAGDDLVRELSAGKRVVFCYGRRDLLRGAGARVVVYEDSSPLYEMALSRRLPGEKQDNDSQTKKESDKEFAQILRSMVEYALGTDESEQDSPSEG